MSVNGIMVPPGNLSLGYNNTENLVEIWADLGYELNVSDTVQVGFSSGWNQLSSSDGSQNTWFMQPNLAVNFEYSMFPPPVDIATMQSIVAQTTSFLFDSFNPLKASFLAKQGWRLFIFSYFLNNFIAFHNLAFLYYFMPFKRISTTYRSILVQALQKIY